MNTLISNNNVENKVSPWEKPGGTLGMIVAGLAAGGGCIVLYKILPFLISLTTNLLTLSLLVLALAAIGFLVTNKRFRQTCSMVYFMVMRKITGLIIEIDPIAIVENKVKEMKKKILDIEKQMGSLNGLNKQNERKIEEKKCQLQKQIDLLNEYNKANKRAEEIKNSSNFYRIELSDADIEEIKMLRSVSPYLRDKEPLNKVIWKVYYEKPTTDMIGRVVGLGVVTGIYKITEISSGKCYVGQAANIADRWK
jgi:hypothetical protein